MSIQLKLRSYSVSSCNGVGLGGRKKWTYLSEGTLASLSSGRKASKWRYRIPAKSWVKFLPGKLPGLWCAPAVMLLQLS